MKTHSPHKCCAVLRRSERTRVTYHSTYSYFVSVAKSHNYPNK